MKQLRYAFLLLFSLSFFLAEARSDTTTVYRGVVHTRLGGGDLSNMAGARLRAGNLGSSGNDGVRIALPDTAWELVLESDIDTGTVISDSAEFRRNHYAVMGGAPNALLGSSTLRRAAAGEWEFTVDDSPMGASAETLKAYLGGALIYTRVYTPTLSAGALLAGEGVMLAPVRVGSLVPPYNSFAFSTAIYMDGLLIGHTWDLRPRLGGALGATTATFLPEGTSDTVVCDHVEVVSNAMPGLSVEDPFALDITSKGIPSFDLYGEEFSVPAELKSVVYAGALQERLGSAILLPRDTTLRLINLGSSGNDGVRISFPDTATSLVLAADVDSTIAIPDGAVIQRNMYAGVNGAPPALLGSSRLLKIDANTWQLSTLNFPPSPTPDTVLFYRKDTLVHTQSWPRNSVIGWMTGIGLNVVPIGYSYKDVGNIPGHPNYQLVHDFNWRSNIAFNPGPAGPTSSASLPIDFDHLEVVSTSDSNMVIQRPFTADFLVGGIPKVTVTQQAYQSLQFTLDPVADTVCAGDSVTITWSGGDPGWTVNLTLVDVAAWRAYSTIAGSTPNDGSHVWHIPGSLPDGVYQVYIGGGSPRTWRYGSNFTVSHCVDPLTIESALPIGVAGCGGTGTLGPDGVMSPPSYFGQPGEFVIRGDPNADILISFMLPASLECVTGGAMNVAFSATSARNLATGAFFNPAVPTTLNLGPTGEIIVSLGMGFTADSACTCPQFAGQILASVEYAAPEAAGASAGAEGSTADNTAAMAATFTCAACGTCVSPPAGMVAWWTGDSTANDHSDESNDGVPLNGVAYSAGKVGPAYVFDGVDDYLEMPDDPSLNFGTGDFSFDAWVKTTSASGVAVIQDKRPVAGGPGYHVHLYNGGPSILIADASGYSGFNSGFSIADGQWHHVAITVARTSATGLRFYVDGALVSAFNPTGRPGSVSNTSVLRIGARSFELSGFFNGGLDEIELFHRALTAGEVYALYAADSLGKCKPGFIGHKYRDENRDQTWGAGEPGIAGWTIFLADNLGAPLASTTTDPQGRYVFPDLAPGTYRIREENRSGWTQTAPPSVVHQVVKTAGAVVRDLDFGNIDSCARALAADTCAAGRNDSYGTADGAELSSPSPALAAVTGGVYKGFDDNTQNTYFLHSFNCWSESCTVVGATLTFRVRTTGSATNDAIQLRYNGSVGLWVEFLGNLPGGGGSWANKDVTFTLDLANLPTSSISAYANVTNILAALQGGGLDVAIQDDSEVDFMALELQLCCPCGLETSVTNSYNAGWNLVSVPVVVPDYSVSAVYPAATGPAFSFSGSYAATTTLDNCRGFWLKFASAGTQTITGAEICNLSCLIGQGWNIIGSASTPTPTASIQTTPAGVISSAFFGYNNGYYLATTIEPGKAYWVKASGGGKLIVGGSSAAGAGSPKAAPVTEHALRLVISDASGAAQTLYIADGGSEGVRAGAYELPPAPPAGIFDARFASQTMVEVVTGASKNEFPIALNGARYPVTVRWQAAGKAVAAFLSAGGRSIPLAQSGTVELQNAEMAAGLAAVVMGQIPSDFALRQAYPNPFNPTTTIAFDLPQDALVTLRVFDLLGREVAVLIDRAPYQAGMYSSEFNAGSLASGLYFYRLTAQGDGRTFSDVKKVLLLR